MASRLDLVMGGSPSPDPKEPNKSAFSSNKSPGGSQQPSFALKGATRAKKMVDISQFGSIPPGSPGTGSFRGLGSPDRDDLHRPGGTMLNAKAARTAMINAKTMGLARQKNAFKSSAEARKEEREKAAIKIQAWFKMCRVALFGPLAFLHTRKMVGRHRAATNLQRVYRGHRARYHPDVAVWIDFRVLEHHAAVDLQRVMRGRIGRIRFNAAKWQAEVGVLMLAAMKLQKVVRGGFSRKATKKRVEFRKSQVAVIERFCKNWFQPWQRAQNKLWDKNLWSIVAVQAKARRFLAHKRVKEMIRTREEMLTSGLWMLGWILLLFLLVLGTVNEREGGGPSHLRRAFTLHMDPHAPPSAPQLGLATEAAVPSLGNVSRPELLWGWLRKALLPRYRGLESWPECSSSSDSNATGSGCGEGGGAASMPLHVAAELSVWQKRSQAVMRTLPRAETVSVTDVCMPTDLRGDVCARRAGLVADEEEEEVAEGEGGQAADTRDAVNSTDAILNVLDGLNESVSGRVAGIEVEAGNKAAVNQAKAWELGNYSRVPSTFLSAHDASRSESRLFGSSFFNFSHDGGLRGVDVQAGRFGRYGPGGYRLTASLTNGTQVSLRDERATDCGVPCVQGIKRAEVAGFVDGRTKAIVAEVAAASMAANALVVATWLIEVSPSGAVAGTAVVTSSRLEAFATFGGTAGVAGDAAVGQILPFALFVLGGCVCLGVSVYLSLYDLHFTSTFHFRVRRKDGSVQRRMLYHFAKPWNAYDVVTALFTLCALLLRVSAQALCSNLLSSPPGNTAQAALDLQYVHATADGFLSAVVAMVWLRGLVCYAMSIRLVRAYLALARRVLMPLVAIVVVLLPVLFAMSHVAVITRGASDGRFAGYRRALTSITFLMWDGADPVEEPHWRRAGRRGGWGVGRVAAVEGGGGVPPAVEALAYLGGLLAAAMVGAVALGELEVEGKVSRELEEAPYLHGGGRRYDRYRVWESPQAVEVAARLRRSVRSRASVREEIRLNMMQSRVLVQLRKNTWGRAKSKFGWKLVHDKHRLTVARAVRTNLRRFSRLMGHQQRAFNKSADLMEFAMEDTTMGMLENTTKLLRKNFVFAPTKWPKASLTKDDVRYAEQLVTDEHERMLDEQVTVQGRRMRQIDRQLWQAQTGVEEVAEKWKVMMTEEAAEADKHKGRRSRR